MAQRGTASSKKAEAAPPAFASVTAADIIRAPVTQKTIPLDLASLIVPFKGQGRLTLRVERMPQRAKLSAGRNNGDGTWSLASDELEDLAYLVPSNLSGGHELTVRIVGFDNSTAQTLKVVPLAIPAWDNDADDAAPAENVVRSSAQAHDPILHNELSKMQSMFAVRDSDIAELRAALSQANAQKESELAAARTAWEAELNQRVAEVAVQARADADKKQQGQTLQAAALEKIAQELNRSQSQAEERLEAERRTWQAQTEHRIAEEASRLRAETDQQFDAERKAWQAQADRKIEEERNRLKAESERQLESERGRWHAEVQQKLVDEFCRSKTETDQKLEAERRQWQAEAEQRAASELSRVKAEADQKLEAERQNWHRQTEQRIADEWARVKTEADQRVEAERQLWQAQASNSGEVERHRLLAEAGERLVAEQKRWQDQTEERLAAERQRWQSESEQRLEAERQNWANNSRSAALEAEARWKSEETVRASAALAQWQQQSAQLLAAESDKCRKLEAALAAALAQPASAPIADGGNAQTDHLCQELAALQGALPERDREIAGLREEMNRQRQDSEAALAAAQVWKSGEETRTQALVAEARAQAQDAIAAAVARAENAERALAQAANAAEAQGQPADTPRWDDAYIDGLRRDISTLRSALASREVELGHARAALDQARVQQVVSRPGNAPIRRFAGPGEEQEETPRSAKQSLVRDFAIMMGVLVPVILAYPYVAVYLPDGLRSGIATVTGGLLSVRVEPLPAAPRPSAPVAAAPRPTATVTRSANIRSAPATTGTILVTLPRDAMVVVLKVEGNWTQVEIPAKDAAGKSQQGWVFSTYLKSPAAPKPANEAAKPVNPEVKPAKPESANAADKPANASTAAESENKSVTAKPEVTPAEPEPAGAPEPAQ